MTARKRLEIITILSSAIVLAALIILSSFAQLIFDERLYIKLLDKNDVVMDERDEQARNVIGFLKGSGGLRYFNEKEKLHMLDVKGMVSKGFMLLYILLALMTAAVAYIWDYAKIGRMLMLGGAIAIGVVLISVIAAPVFDIVFLKFHQVFFTNDLWMLNPETDKLIVLFPEGFFMDFTANILIRMLVMSLALIALGYSMRRLGSHLKPAPGQ
jgi:integral membrane protein (TIGR01906 family)